MQMEEIMEIARENDLMVIEDAAHAIGSKYKDKCDWKYWGYNLF